ncbi:amidohydrolase family protein [Microlunatus flavus]|uniref:L-fuconolactonase n=1 Tax=Microlunatus flavus TaxID=1036181 RepID=A0A1H9B2C4_9ACTN|nr:amidohydrolase family protein [Microlunatus flavus]SEP83009.1 L-fuconolactonase [Microlunatus flavus]
MTLPETPGARIVDAHLHLWELGTGDYGWNTPDLGPVHTDFDAEQAGATLASGGVDEAVLVQAADTAGDSERMFAAADEHPWVAGVVAWVPLRDPHAAESLLDRWSATGRLAGIRQLLHDDPDPTRLDAPAVRATLALLAERGLPLDVPDAWPDLWPALLRVLDDLPDLVVVLDHLGKPALDLDAAGRPADPAAFDAWRQGLAEVARHPQAVAKLSGLDAALAAGVEPSAERLRPLVEAALETFGPERLMLGGDWPVSLGHAPYAVVVEAVRGSLAGLGDAERAAVLGGTAARVYRLPPRPEVPMRP